MAVYTNTRVPFSWLMRWRGAGLVPIIPMFFFFFFFFFFFLECE
jgi:hypothetical protein